MTDSTTTTEPDGGKHHWHREPLLATGQDPVAHGRAGRRPPGRRWPGVAGALAAAGAAGASGALAGGSFAVGGVGTGALVAGVAGLIAVVGILGDRRVPAALGATGVGGGAVVAGVAVPIALAFSGGAAVLAALAARRPPLARSLWSPRTGTMLAVAALAAVIGLAWPPPSRVGGPEVLPDDVALPDRAELVDEGERAARYVPEYAQDLVGRALDVEGDDLSCVMGGLQLRFSTPELIGFGMREPSEGQQSEIDEIVARCKGA
jgi:hypothetical protein